MKKSNNSSNKPTNKENPTTETSNNVLPPINILRNGKESILKELRAGLWI
jgi:hypothetical protein